MESNKPVYSDLRAERVVLQFLASAHISEFQNILIQEGDFFSLEHREIYKALERAYTEGLSSTKDAYPYISSQKALDLFDQYCNSYESTMHQAVMYADALRSYTLNRKLLAVKAKIDNPPPDLSPMDLIDTLSNDLASINNGTESSQRYRTGDIVSKIIQNNSYEAVRKRPRGIKTYIPSIDQVINLFSNRELITFGAPSGHGKTSLALTMAYHQAIAGHKVGFFALEMTPESLYERFAQIHTYFMYGENNYISLDKLSKMHGTRDDHQRFEDAVLDMSTKLNIITYYGEEMKLSDIRRYCAKLKYVDNVDIIYIDYLQIITPDNTNVPREQQIAQMSKAFKRLALVLDIPIVILTQLNRNVNANLKRPSAADIRESSAVEHDSDKIILFWTPKDMKRDDETIPDDLCEVNIAKNRKGKKGYLDLTFIKEVTLLKDREESKYNSHIPF